VPSFKFAGGNLGFMIARCKKLSAALILFLAMALTSCSEKFDYDKGASMTGGNPQAVWRRSSCTIATPAT